MEEMSKKFKWMMQFHCKMNAATFLFFLIFSVFGTSISALAKTALSSGSAVLSTTEQMHLPLSSFLFAHRDPMRVGWFTGSTESGATEEKGYLFVQLKPRKDEGEYRLALRVLRDGGHQFQMIRNLSGGKAINHRKYLTIPFEHLIGAIQGEAIRSLFPNDQIVSGGWLHKVTYVWETSELLDQIFLDKRTSSPKHKLAQGEQWIIPWHQLRDDLDLEPMAVREPLVIRKDESGFRYAYYQLQRGDTLYSSVVSRFIGETRHEVRNQVVGDLLVMNKMTDPHQLSEGLQIKIPLEWLSPEYLHPIPTIYKVSNDLEKDKIWRSSVLPQTEQNSIFSGCKQNWKPCNTFKANQEKTTDGLPLKIRISPQQFSQR